MQSSFFRAAADRYARLRARVGDSVYARYQAACARLFGQRALNILFTRKASWENSIQDGFRRYPHRITFDALSPETIGAHDLVVPLNLEDLIYLNNHRELICHNAIPIPSLDCIQLCEEKVEFNRTLAALGYGKNVPRMDESLAKPYIIKKKVDVWSANSHMIADAECEQAFAELRTHPDYFCQEVVPGRAEYALHLIFKNRQIVYALTVKYLFRSETPIKGKDRSVCTGGTRNRFLGLFSAILGQIGFEGICCFNYKIHRGRPMIFELNPRFGGSFAPYFASAVRYLSVEHQSEQTGASEK